MVNKRRDLERDAYMAIMKVARAFTQLNKADTRDYDLSPPQYSVLRHATRAGVSMTEISTHMLADNSSLTRVVDRMEARGLVVRVADARDRRVCLIKLTAQGEALKNKVMPIRVRSVEKRFSTLKNSELETIIAGLGALVDHDS